MVYDLETKRVWDCLEEEWSPQNITAYFITFFAHSYIEQEEGDGEIIYFPEIFHYHYPPSPKLPDNKTVIIEGIAKVRGPENTMREKKVTAYFYLDQPTENIVFIPRPKILKDWLYDIFGDYT